MVDGTADRHFTRAVERLGMTDDAVPVEERLGDALRDRGQTIATAESCTGGGLAARITDVPGASEYFDRAFVTYSYDAKRETLAVSREALDQHGAVSAPVAREMAAAARDLADATWGVATTGIAGPSGGTPEKPVGTVFLGVAYAGAWGSGESATTAVRAVFDGGRTAVREATADRALELVLERVRETS